MVPLFLGAFQSKAKKVEMAIPNSHPWSLSSWPRKHLTHSGLLTAWSVFLVEADLVMFGDEVSLSMLSALW